MIHKIGNTSNGTAVGIDLIRSSISDQISRNPHLISLAREALSGMTLDKPHVVITQNMGREIGYNFVVEVANPENVFYAQIIKESTFMPFTKKGDPKSTSLLTMILDYSEAEDSYILQDIWIGPFKPPYPTQEDTTVVSKRYWEKHAHIFRDQPVKASTITRTCPY